MTHDSPHEIPPPRRADETAATRRLLGLLGRAALSTAAASAVLAVVLAYLLATGGGPGSILALLGLGALLVVAVALFALLSVAWLSVRLVAFSVAATRARLYERAVSFGTARSPVDRSTLAVLLAPLDSRTPAERSADAIDEIRSRYVAGDIDERGLERELDRAMAIETDRRERPNASDLRERPAGRTERSR